MRNKLLAMIAALTLFSASFASAQVASTVRVGKVSFVRGTAGLSVAEASDFTAAADTAGSLSAKTFRFYDASDAHCYQVWYDVDNGSSAPAATSGCTLVPVDIATGDTATTVAGNTRTVLNAAPYTTYFAITGGTSHIIVTSLTKGVATDGNIMTSGFTVSKTQGVSGSAALADADVVPGLQGWSLCNDIINTSTWLAVGKAVDPDTDGTRLGKGECFKCPNCTAASLKAVKLSAQAASDGYAVIQFKE